MSGKGVLIDSVIFIDHLNRVSAASRYLQGVERSGHVSAITRAEVLAGVSPASVPAVRRLLDAYAPIALDSAIADLAGELRRRHRLKLPDAFQAAAASHHGLDLATRNTKDFPRRTFGFVVVPYTP